MALLTQTVTHRTTGELYWFEVPTADYELADGVPPGATVHGPFKTKAEVAEHQRRTLVGEESTVTEGGMWDPNWNKPQ